MGSIGATSAFLACGIWCGPPEVAGPWLRADGPEAVEPASPYSEPRSGSAATGPSTTAAGTPPGHPEQVRSDRPPSPAELLLWRDLHPDWLPDWPAPGQHGAGRSRITTDSSGDPAGGSPGSSPGRTADPTDEVLG
ncbi:DUF6059 family protein [Frankia tisae]|uniref:DUF6059 family protein n=1 Tax=Frankia tisae TaxID=2950104 RepID=UPI0021BF4CA8|nr:DUF6059 family protein [Frankia tisae]